jgi:integrase
VGIYPSTTAPAGPARASTAARPRAACGIGPSGQASRTTGLTHARAAAGGALLDDANVSTRKISDQLGHSKISMTQDRYLGRKLTDRQTADVLEKLLGSEDA